MPWIGLGFGPTLWMAVFTTPAVRAQTPASAKTSTGVIVDLSKKPEYWRDARLEATYRPPKEPPSNRVKPLLAWPNPEFASLPDDYRRLQPARTVGFRLIELGDVLQAVEQETGVSVRTQADWQDNLLAIPLAGVPARELMEWLELGGKAWWYSISGKWVLCSAPGCARWTVLSRAERDEQLLADERKLLSWKWYWWQVKRLTGLDGMPGHMMRPEEYSALKHFVALRYFDPEIERRKALTESVFSGKTPVILRLSGAGKKRVLRLTAPTNTGRWTLDLPYYSPDGTLRFGTEPPS